MSDTPIEEVTDAELIDAFIAARETEMMTAFPAQVTSYNASNQTVEVIPVLAKHIPDGQGNYIPELPPKLGNVPVCFPRSQHFFLAFPLAVGDEVLIVVCQKNIGNWRATGNAGDPGDIGMHTLDGAVAIPGVFQDKKKLSDASSSTMKMGKDGTSAAQIEMTADKVLLGGGSQFVALANLVKSQLDSIAAALTAHTHSGVQTGGGSSGPSNSTYTSAAVAAANVKAT